MRDGKGNQSPNSFGVLSFLFVAPEERVPRDSSERLGEAITFTDWRNINALVSKTNQVHTTMHSKTNLSPRHSHNGSSVFT